MSPTLLDTATSGVPGVSFCIVLGARSLPFTEPRNTLLHAQLVAVRGVVPSFLFCSGSEKVKMEHDKVLLREPAYALPGVTENPSSPGSLN